MGDSLSLDVCRARSLCNLLGRMSRLAGKISEDGRPDNDPYRFGYQL